MIAEERRHASSDLLEGQETALQYKVTLPEHFPFPYNKVEYTPEQEKVLLTYFTNLNDPVCAMKNLPEEVKAAILCRYSRSSSPIRPLFLEEFWENQDDAVKHITDYLVSEEGETLKRARRRSKRLYETMVSQFGDESTKQMGSVHIFFEGVSQIATKVIEDGRIGVAFIEKSTRYIFFIDQETGELLFARVPEIMDSQFKEEFLNWNSELFAAYQKHHPVVLEHTRQRFPLEDQEFINTNTGIQVKFGELTDPEMVEDAKRAYESAIQGKTLDLVRLFLPLTTVTNLGAHLSGQAAELMVNKMLASAHGEVRLLGALTLQELLKVTPNFFLEVPKYGPKQSEYRREVTQKQIEVARKFLDGVALSQSEEDVSLVWVDEDSDVRVASHILYDGQEDRGLSEAQIYSICKAVKERETKEAETDWSPTLVNIILDSLPDRKGKYNNRRYKLPRAFEVAFAKVNYNKITVADWRDLQRQRLETNDWAMITAEDIRVTDDFNLPGLEHVKEDLVRLAGWTKDLNRRMRDSDDPAVFEASQYVVMFCNTMSFLVNANLRQWGFVGGLRTDDGAGKDYRKKVHEALRLIINKMPWTEDIFAHVNWTEDVGLGRLKSAFRSQKKKRNITK